MKNIITVVTILLVITACSYKDETITDPDKTISVTKPSFWLEIESLNDDAEIKIGNPIAEAYFIIITESRKDFPNDYTLKKYSDLTRGFIKEGTKDFSETHDKSMSNLNGMDAIKYTINATVNNTKITYWHISVKSKTNFYQLLAWSLPSKLNSNKDSFITIINSFRELK